MNILGINNDTAIKIEILVFYFTDLSKKLVD